MANAAFWIDRTELATEDDAEPAWNKTYADNPWDAVIFNNEDQLPGIAVVKAERHRRVERKIPKGQKEEAQTITGFTPANIEITLTLWTAKQWDVLQVMMGDYFEHAGSKFADAAFKVTHPALSLIAVTEMSIVKVSTPAIDGNTQIGTVTITGLEFTGKPKAKGGKTKEMVLTTETIQEGKLFSAGIHAAVPPGQDNKSKRP